MVPDRAAGFSVNPNTAAFLLVCLCCALVRFDRVRLGDGVLLLLTGMGVMATLSRGGALLLALLVARYAYFALDLRHFRLTRVVGGALVVGALGALAYAAAVLLLERASIFAVPGPTRFSQFFGEGQVLTREESRTHVLLESLALAFQRPLLGYGSGFTYTMPVGPHNIYVQQWMNSGLFGLAAYLWLLVAVAKTFWARASRAGLTFVGLVALQGFFSHNLLEERIFLVLLGILLADSYFSAGVAVPTRGAHAPGAGFAVPARASIATARPARVRL
jgi:O-antigen ligase